MRHLQGFDGIRALACLAVLLHHFFQRLDTATPFRHMFELGEVGVSLFFVLSGALLAYPFWCSLSAQKASLSLRHYILHRAARVIPAYYVVLLVSFFIGCLTLNDTPYSIQRLLAGLLFVAPYHYISFFPTELNPPLWSIGLEVSCYVLLPIFLCPLIYMLKNNTHRLFLAFFYILILMIALQIVHYWIIKHFMTSPIEKGWQYGIIGGAKQWLPYWNIASFMTQFLLGSAGSLLIVMYKHLQQKNKKPSIMKTFPIVFDFFTFILLILTCAVISRYITPGQPSSITQQAYFSPFLAVLFTLTLFSLHYSCIIHKLFDNGVFRHIARLPFGLYLWHFMLMELVRLLWFPDYVYGGMTSLKLWVILSALVFVGSWLLSALSFHYLEYPVLQWVRRYTTSRSGK